jgi:hypothetical protein
MCPPPVSDTSGKFATGIHNASVMLTVVVLHELLLSTGILKKFKITLRELTGGPEKFMKKT